MLNRNFIIFSSVDWNDHKQLHHHLVDHIVKSGGNVLFIENTGVRSPKMKDVSRIYERVKSRLSSVHGFRKINKNLTIYTPAFIPYPYNKFSIFFNTLIIQKSINNWINLAEFKNYHCLTFLPTPLILNLMRRLKARENIYYCVDDMARSVKDPKQIRESEIKIIRYVEVVFVTANALLKFTSKYNKNSHLIPSGLDTDVFPPEKTPERPSELMNLNSKIIGYIGAISDVFDQELVLNISKNFPNYYIVIVGPRFTSTKKINNQDNIIFIDRVSKDRLPEYIFYFDMAIIPYRVNSSTNMVYPTKLNEYLSMGKKVISTPIYEVKLFSKENDDVIFIAKNAQEFSDLINKNINIVDQEAVKSKRISISMKNSWDSRFRDFDKILEAINTPHTKKNTQQRLKSFYRERSRKKLILSIFFLSIYLIYSQTKILFNIAESLVVKDKIDSAEAIVVFSGDGETDYRNLSYQERALDAVKIYKKGFSEKIFISSGRNQTISDVEIIRLYLLSHGVPEGSIFILKEYPDSTFKNVLLVKNLLDEQNIKKIIFLTAPYHSLRAKMLWNSNAPKIQILVPDLREEIKTTVDFKKLRIITIS